MTTTETTQETTYVDDDATSDTGTAPATETAAPEADPADDTGKVRPGNREARYRVERNQAREALESAEALLGGYRSREIERLAAVYLSQPSDLLTLGEVTLTSLLTDDGFVDAEAVASAAAALVESRPGLAKNPKVLATDPTQGQGGRPPGTRASWESFLKV